MLSKLTKTCTFALFLILLFNTACSPQNKPDKIVIQNGLLFKATGEALIPKGAVVIEEGLITAVGLESELEFPMGATILDAQGGTIMPGLIEARASTLINEFDIIEGQINETDLTFFLTRPLQAGITTMRAVGWDYSTRPNLSGLREALAKLGNQVPTIVFVNVITHAEGNVFAIYPEDSIGVVTLEDVQAATENLILSGVDQVGFLQPFPPDYRAINAPLVSLSFKHQTTFVELAHEQGLRVLAQTSFPDDAAVAVAAGVDELIVWPHATEEPLPDELIQALVDNSVEVLTGFSVIKPHEGDVRRFIDAGGVVVFGTFAPNSTALESPINEMNLMSTFGEMTPFEIIMSATANAAEAVGLEDVIGTLEIGKQADIIIVQGNPLDDIGAIENIATVIKAGEVVFQADSEE